jgi:hypothetical protein
LPRAHAARPLAPPPAPPARRSMPQFADASFAAVLDKGTLDALLCGGTAAADAAAALREAHRRGAAAGARGGARRRASAGPRESERGAPGAPDPLPPRRPPALRPGVLGRRRRLRIKPLSLYRVLRPGGCCMLITYGGPESRLPHLAAPHLGWDVQARAPRRARRARGAEGAEGRARRPRRSRPAPPRADARRPGLARGS